MSTVQICGKTTFGLCSALRNARKYLNDTGSYQQIENLPETYPKTKLHGIDVVAKSKILKAHLEDMFPQNRFSTRITRRKKKSSISVTTDASNLSQIQKIAGIYADSAVRVSLNRFGE